MFSHARTSAQALEEYSAEVTRLDNVAEICVPRTAEVQSIAVGHAPVKISKYSSCITRMASRTACIVPGAPCGCVTGSSVGRRRAACTLACKTDGPAASSLARTASAAENDTK